MKAVDVRGDELDDSEYKVHILQVQCKAVLCPTHFKSQKFCEMLKEICPEIDSSTGGVIQSSRLGSLYFLLPS